MKVTLLNPESLTNFFKEYGQYSHICSAKNYNKSPEENKRIGRNCLKYEHFSGSRSIYMNFLIEEVSRGCVDQLIRKEQGTVKNVQSTRYIDMSNFDYYIGEDILKNEKALKIYKENMEKTRRDYMSIIEILKNEEGCSKKKAQEQARGLLGLGIHSKLVIGFTLESLIDLMHRRLCTKSQKEIRDLVKEIKNIVTFYRPEFIPYLVPQCEYLHRCTEKDSCGRIDKKLKGRS